MSSDNNETTKTIKHMRCTCFSWKELLNLSVKLLTCSRFSFSKFRALSAWEMYLLADSVVVCCLDGLRLNEREKKPTVNTLHSFIRPFKSVVGIPLNTDHKNIFFIITVHETIFWCNVSWDCDKILNKNMNVVIFSLYKMYNYWQNFLQIDVLVNFS